ncbi:TPA: HNH endonuclease [Corynebacterium striatum]|nr:HNH endonuclease [Corynebacterium striatum]HAT1336602.1 HNH endonuclease [Corynebacterium striatum]HAT1382099.1 HNH endonuclease [Corynebacterium striatum]HAT1456567.1 HNH endonuclease [Corynebacterium striatum]HAT6595296.1 HNH endonuclease [Corynebacterium striatum]
MTLLAQFLRAQAQGTALLADAAGLSERELLELGASEVQARSLRELAQVYFGETKFKKMKRRARSSRHGLATLQLIEKYARMLRNQRDAWRLREELCTMTGSDSALRRRARKLVKELSKPRAPREGIRLTRRRGKPWTLALTGPSDIIAQLHAAVDPQRPVESVREAFFNGVAEPIASTNVIVTLDELDQIVDGGGEEITLRLTNGATIRGADLVHKTLSERGYVTLVHPHEGPVNLYRTSRFANEKQRLMAAAENPTCPWGDCNYPADLAQIHHLEAWSNGGETNMRNLSTCCPYHNGVNDDSPPGSAPEMCPSRGRLERIHGKVRWLPPWAQ